MLGLKSRVERQPPSLRGESHRLQLIEKSQERGNNESKSQILFVLCFLIVEVSDIHCVMLLCHMTLTAISIRPTPHRV